MQYFLNDTQNRVLISIFLVPALIYSIYSLRKKHPGHVYTIWYAHWFTTTWVSGLFIYITLNYRTLSSGPLGANGILGGWAVWFFDSSLNLREEAYFLAAIYVILILPQFFAFLTAGISGCANNLVFVRLITTTLTWFVIKSFAVLSGIFLAQSIACFYGNPSLPPSEFLRRFATSIMMLSLSFISAAIFYMEYSFRFRRIIVITRKKFAPITERMKKQTILVHNRDKIKQNQIRYRWVKKKISEIGRGLLEY